MTILVTGGAGYIATHTIIELLANHHNVVVVDNYVNSNPEALRRVGRITGAKVTAYDVDCCDEPSLRKVFAAHPFDAVIHFAGLKAVGESVAKPLEYYTNNLDSTLVLCHLMQEFGVKQLIFSSSATVYGTPEELPLKETSRTGLGITNPYGQTKYMIEQILRDIAVSDPEWRIIALRYFNPVGAHASGLIGEDPSGPPNNLLPYISQVAVGRLPRLRVFGDTYDTPDGTGVRDYIHVVDLAKGHVAAAEHLGTTKGMDAYNLGTGKGVSVFELLHAFEKACGKQIPYEVVEKRPGDVASCYADPTKAEQQLGWHAEKSIDDACADAWRWQSQNPYGYTATESHLYT